MGIIFFLLIYLVFVWYIKVIYFFGDEEYNNIKSLNLFEYLLESVVILNFF